MTGETPDEVVRTYGLEARSSVAPAVLASLPGLVPLVAAPVTLTTAFRMRPWCYELHAPAGPVGLLLRKDPTVMQALCAANTWTLTTRRRARRRWMGVADELSTGEAVAAYYPVFGVGGSIALHDTHYKLTLPWLRSGWWVRDEDRRAIAVFHEKRNVSLRVELRQDCTRVGEHLTLVLLLALWATVVTPRARVAEVTGGN